jgi:hypothetical protein
VEEEYRARHRIFLLRCTRESPATAGELAEWQFTLSQLEGKRPRRAFGDLQDLIRYLEACLAEETEEK